MSRPQLLGAQPSLAITDLFGAGFLPPAGLAGVLLTSPDVLAETDRSPAEALAAAGDFDGAWGAEAERLTTPEQACAFAEAGFTRLSIDPCAYHVARADSLGAAELDDAANALVEDGAMPPAWPELYPQREVPISATFTLRFSDEELRRTAVRFGWAVAFFEEIAAAAGPNVEREFSAAGLARAITPLDHWFIARECERRGVPLVTFAPPLPPEWLLAAAFDGDAAAFAARLAVHAQLAQACGPHQVSLSAVEEKHALLPALAAACGGRLALKAPCAATLAAWRTVARAEPELFRQALAQAQEVFAFARPAHPLAISEDDIRFLPEVPNHALEDTFLGHAHGRQLLAVTTPALLGRGVVDGQPLRAQLHAVLATHRALYREIVARDLQLLATAAAREP